MADLKISQLTSATLPLAGTEVLPIVQSSSTKKVATDDLTVKNVRSNATTGILQVAGPGASTTRVMTTPDANFTSARTDAAQSFTGDQTLSTGNLIIGTSGKGIDFSATPGTGTSELLADYEEGTWTPVYDSSGASFTYDEQYGWYVRVGALVTIQCRIKAATATGTTSNPCRVSGLPFATGSLSALSSTPGAIGLSTFPTTLAATSNNASSIITLWQAGTTNQPTAADAVGAFFTLSMTYRAA
jgi:hypothetical protein